MDINQEEYRKWLVSERNKVHARYTREKTTGKCPRIEKLRDFRKSRSPLNTGYWYKKESKWVKKTWNKKTRMKLNQQLYNEAYYSVYAKDYKTYGWMTW